MDVYTLSSAGHEIDWKAQGEERVLQNVCNLLRLWTGDIPFLRHVGIDVSVIDRPMPEAEALIAAELVRNIDEYQLGVEVLEVRFSRTGDGFVIEADVEIVDEDEGEDDDE